MKNKTISLLLVCVLVFTAFLGTGTKVNASTSFTNYTFKLHTTQEFLDQYKSATINPATVDSTVDKFGHKVDDKTWLNLNLKVGEGENPIVTGNGVLHMGTDTFPLNIEGQLDEYIINDDQEVYFGPVYGAIKTSKTDENIIIGLYLDKQNNTANASLSVGELDENGVSILLFGDTNDNFNQVVDSFEKRVTEYQSTKKTTDELSAYVIDDGGGGGGGDTTNITSNLGDYTYVNSNYSRWYSDDNGWWDITKAPANSQILNYTSSSEYVIILDAFKGDMGNSAINRVWSDSDVVKKYTGAVVADAFVIYSWFGSSSPNIHIHTVGPANGTSYKLPTWIGFVASFTKLGAVYTIVEQALNWGFSQDVSVADEDSLEKHDTYSNRTHQRGKYIKYGGIQADLRTTTITSLEENAKLNGGASFNFDYNNYGTNKSLSSGAQIAYGVSYDYHIAFVWSDKVTVSWTQ